MKQNWYFTFAENHEDPNSGMKLHGYWVRVHCKDPNRARAEIIAKYGSDWKDMYSEAEFRKIRHNFVKGELLIINILEEWNPNQQKGLR